MPTESEAHLKKYGTSWALSSPFGPCTDCSVSLKYLKLCLIFPTPLPPPFNPSEPSPPTSTILFSFVSLPSSPMVSNAATFPHRLQ